jgi:hypothetical protein
MGRGGRWKRERLCFSNLPALARRCGPLRWHGVAYDGSFQRGAANRRETRRHSLLGCTYPHHKMQGRKKLPWRGAAQDWARRISIGKANKVRRGELLAG